MPTDYGEADMNVDYKCGCMAEQATIEVPDRIEGQALVDWMKGCVVPAIDGNHASRSPDCRSEVMEYARIAVDPAGGPLGTLTRQ